MSAASISERPQSYILLILLVILEHLPFRTYVSRELTCGYSQNHDQTLYLFRSYLISERILQHDFHSIFRFLPNTPHGILLQLEEAFFFSFAAALRLTTLTANFLYLVAGQLSLFSTLKSITHKLCILFVGLALFLIPMATFLGIGGITDYRLELVAPCLFLIFLGLELSSNILFVHEMFCNQRVYRQLSYLASTPLFCIFLRNDSLMQLCINPERNQFKL